MNERMLRALERGALWGRTDLAILESDGPDLLTLLNRLSTQKLDELGVGESAATVLTSAKGRIVERLWLTRLDETRTLLIAGPGRASAILDHLKRYTFAEKTGLRDASDSWALLVPFGDWPLPEGLPGRLLPHDVDSDEGRSLLLPRDAFASALESARQQLDSLGGVELNDAERERLRILRGLPASGAELSEDYNPLEAGLRYAISFNKGCYVGQEVVARLNTYDKVSRSLLGLRADAGEPLTPDSALYLDGKSIGTLTSSDGEIGLAYIKHRNAKADDVVNVGDPEGPTATLCSLPFKTC